MTARLALPLVLVAATARAQPVTRPDELPPLAELRDDKQLADALATITQDPSIHVDDAKARTLAQALMTEGVHQLQNRAYDQALANFLEAYNKFPHPKLLLAIASTLRDMGRAADAANTYQRYLSDPATSAERMSEVKELLHRLDEQLTILTVRVFPRGSELSIDGGPFVAVGTSLQTRVRPGIHMIRVRHGASSNELTVNGFENENKDVNASVKVEVDATPTTTPLTTAPPTTPPPTTPPTTTTQPTTTTPPPTPASSISGLPVDATPEHVDGWLITGTQYGADAATGRARRVRTGFAGPEVAPIVPRFDSDGTDVIVHYDAAPRIASGVIVIARLDSRDVVHDWSSGLGVAIARGHVELELAALHSNEWGAYAGARYRLFTGFVRPYVGGGLPLWVYALPSGMKSSTEVSVGLRAAGGVELYINPHLSVLGDLGYEHFFNTNGRFFTDYFAPTLGVIGRL